MNDNKKTQKKSFKFTKDVFWVGLSQVVIYVFGFFALPALTKTFGVELYGLWAQIGVTVGLLNPILTLHLGTATVRYLSSERNKEILSQSFANMFYLIILMGLFTILIAFLFKSTLSVFLFKSEEYALFIILTFIWATTGALFAFLIAYLRAKGEIKRLSLINIVIYFLKFTPLIILASLGYPLWFIIISQIIVEFIFIIWLFISITKNIGFKWPNKNNLEKYLSFSIPQIPGGALLWIIDSSDRYFITNYLGLVQTGIYSASYTLGSIISMFYLPLSFVIYPVISSLWEQKKVVNVKKYMEYSTKLFLALAIPGSVGLYVLSKPLLSILTTSDFLSGGGVLTFLISLSTIFLGLYQINLYIIYLVEKTKIIPFIIGLSALINVVLNIILIPNLGILGAAISTIASYATLSIIVLIWSKKRINYSFDFTFLFKIILASILMAFIIGILPLKGILSILIAAIIGTIIYMISLFVLRTFSDEEKKIVYESISEFKNQIFLILHS